MLCGFIGRNMFPSSGLIELWNFKIHHDVFVGHNVVPLAVTRTEGW